MSALSVLAWPSAAAPAWQDDLVALATRVPVDATGGNARERARADIRAAICEVAGLLTSTGAERIEVADAPGTPPRLLIDGEEVGIGVSISHAENDSVAVLHRNGAVGVDVMQIGIGSDWARVAHDYFGMTQATLLAAASDDERPAAFCRAWVRREAGLKLRGEKLKEAEPGLPASAGRFVELALEDGLVGVVALDQVGATA